VDKDDTFTGSARARVTKLANGKLRVSILSGTVNASW
jgi:hypothetical protein